MTSEENFQIIKKIETETAKKQADQRKKKILKKKQWRKPENKRLQLKENKRNML